MFSRCGTGLKIRFQLLPELKMDMSAPASGRADAVARETTFAISSDHLVCIMRLFPFVRLLEVGERTAPTPAPKRSTSRSWLAPPNWPHSRLSPTAAAPELNRNFRTASPESVSGPRCCHSATSFEATGVFELELAELSVAELCHVLNFS